MGDGKRWKDILVEHNVEIIISFQEERANITKNKWAAFVFILKVHNGKIITEREKDKITHCVFMCHYIYYQLLDFCTDTCQAWKNSKEVFFSILFSSNIFLEQENAMHKCYELLLLTFVIQQIKYSCQLSA